MKIKTKLLLALSTLSLSTALLYAPSSQAFVGDAASWAAKLPTLLPGVAGVVVGATLVVQPVGWLTIGTIAAAALLVSTLPGSSEKVATVISTKTIDQDPNPDLPTVSGSTVSGNAYVPQLGGVARPYLYITAAELMALQSDPYGPAYYRFVPRLQSYFASLGYTLSNVSTITTSLPSYFSPSTVTQYCPTAYGGCLFLRGTPKVTYPTGTTALPTTMFYPVADTLTIKIATATGYDCSPGTTYSADLGTCLSAPVAGTRAIASKLSVVRH